MKLFRDVDINNLKDLIDDFIVKVNPGKLLVNKKKNLGRIKIKKMKKIKNKNEITVNKFYKNNLFYFIII